MPLSRTTVAAATSHLRWLRAFAIAIPVIYALVLALFAARVGTSDYDQFLVFHELQYWNATLFGVAKQWTPVMCAGLSLAGEPQIPFASLTMLAGYAFGPLTGIVIGNACYIAIGWIGGFLYSGLWSRERALRALAASLFIGNGFFICRIAHGHDDFLPFLALPLALWVIHGATRQQGAPPPIVTLIRNALLLGCLFTVVIDGSPVAIVHWLLWIAIYAATLSWVRRSPQPALVFVGAAAVACILDAGYLWPMLHEQIAFPRSTPDTFTGPWSLPWFMLLPMRGKLLPANGTGIELSVFIGPVLLYLIWRYRNTLSGQMPRQLKVPLLVVSLVSIWLGMGSLRAAHLPVWLSPFDWLRPLPGFRSLNVTGRFWGFLALPLSLLAAHALWRHVTLEPVTRRKAILLGAAICTQLAFQGESLLSAWRQSYVPVQESLQGLYAGKPEDIATVFNPGTKDNPRLQGEFITPVRAVTNCYDMDDFERPSISPGARLIGAIRADGDTSVAGGVPVPLQAGFMTWNRIRIAATEPAASTPLMSTPSVLHITLNQAYHVGWTSTSCTTSRGEDGRLVAKCSGANIGAAPIDLVFFDPVSALGARVSERAIIGVSAALLLLQLLSPLPMAEGAWRRSGKPYRLS